MISTPSYRKAFYFALGLHLFLAVMLLTDNSVSKPVVTAESKSTPGMQLPIAATPQPEVVKAVSVDNQEVMKTVNRLKQEREQKQRTEINRQRDLDRQLQQAKQQRIKEQQNIARLKEEANKIAIARKKQAEAEVKRLKELVEQKSLEAKHIEELKKQEEKLIKQQELETKKLAELNKKKTEEKVKADKLKAEREHAEKLKADKAAVEQAKADSERKRQEQAAVQQAQQNAENQARMAGEVNKYKALIVNAIGNNWILPENVDKHLECKFRIRLSPTGDILAVNLISGSGDPLLDRSAESAIRKASPLPVPTDVETFNMFRDISLTVRPEQVRG